MAGLLARGHQLLVVEELGGVADDGVVGAVVLAQEDLAGELLRVEVVEALQEGLVEAALQGEAGEHLGAQLHVVA